MGVNWNNINRSGARSGRNRTSLGPTVNLPPFYDAGSVILLGGVEWVVELCDCTIEGLVILQDGNDTRKYRISYVEKNRE